MMSATDGKGSTCRGSVTVVVRVRCENNREKETGLRVVTKVVDEKVIVFDPKLVSSPEFYQGRKRKFRDLNKRENKNAFFQFDRVFDECSSNADVFEHTTKDVVDDVLNGFNACVFAYGATGAGKTFTMLGTPENPGVIFLSVMAMYEKIDSISDKFYDVAVSYLEVYNENIQDLLKPGAPLALREDEHGEMVIAGLSLHRINSATELLQMLSTGNKNRTQHPTDANAESSRSHAVFQVYVKQHDRMANTTANIKVGKLSLIDLAGSERATVTKNRGARFREGANINRSLLALGNCINALADGKSKNYIPYRNSKLTRLLKDSLGGNCRTVMIAALSPSALSYEDTYNTLRYANRAKEIKVDVKQNNLSVEYHISQYPKMIQDLRSQVAELQVKLSEWENGKTNAVAHAHSLDQASEFSSTAAQNDAKEQDGFKEALHNIFNSRVNIRKELMELEGSEKILTLKVFKKEVTLSRMRLFTNEADHEKTVGELQRNINATQQRIKKIVNRKAALDVRMKENEAELVRIEAEMKEIFPNMPELLQLVARCRRLEVELRDTCQQSKYLKKISRIQQRDSVANERLVSALLKCARRNHYILRGHGLSTTEMDNEFQSLQRLLLGTSQVAWEDDTAGGDLSMNGTSFDQLLQFPTSGLKLTPSNQVNVSTDADGCPSHAETCAVTPVCGTEDSVNSSLLTSVVDFVGSPSCGVTNEENDPMNSTFTVGPALQLISPVCPKLSCLSITPGVTDAQSTVDDSSPGVPPVFIGKLTFADVVKSPGRPILNQSVALKAGGSRSPLKSQNSSTLNARKPMLTLSAHKSAAPVTPFRHQSVSETCAIQSSADRRRKFQDVSSSIGAIKPSYMRMTHASSYRHMPYARSDTNSIKLARIPGARRVPLSQNKSNNSRIFSTNVQSVGAAPQPTRENQRQSIMF